MSVDPFAPSPISQQGPSQSWMANIQAAGDAFIQKVDAAVGGIFNMITDKLDGMTESLRNYASEKGAGVSASIANMGSGGFSPFPGGQKSDPTPARTPELAIESPPMPEHVQSQARAALSGVSMPSIQMANVDPSQQVSASHTPGVGYGQGQAMGGMAMG